MARLTPLERWESKVDKTGDCWLWTGRLDSYGYGKFRVASREGGAHRWGYVTLVGPVPDGLQLDHLCHSREAARCASQPGPCVHRRCVNPDHLEPVTQRVNTLRGNTFQAVNAAKTHCVHGHAFTLVNTGRDCRGRRFCRACATIRQAAYRHRKRLISEAALIC